MNTELELTFKKTPNVSNDCYQKKSFHRILNVTNLELDAQNALYNQVPYEVDEYAVKR